MVDAEFPGRFEDDGIAREVSGEFIKTIGIIVQQKISRFRSKLPLLKKNSDKFAHITHPIDQLKVIANSTAQFIQKLNALCKKVFKSRLPKINGFSFFWEKSCNYKSNNYGQKNGKNNNNRYGRLIAEKHD